MDVVLGSLDYIHKSMFYNITNFYPLSRLDLDELLKEYLVVFINDILSLYINVLASLNFKR